MTTSIKLGALTFDGYGNAAGFYRVSISNAGGLLSTIWITPAEWQSLLDASQLSTLSDSRHAADRAEILRLDTALLHARNALAQLHHDIDGYDQTFSHARWIAAGRPCSFDEWLQLEEQEERGLDSDADAQRLVDERRARANG